MIPSALETEWAERLAELIQPFKPAALILQVPSTGALANLLANAQAAELAVLFVDAVHQTREMGANGVYLSTPGSGISNVRRELGASSIIGAACGLSRHVAMETAETGADFVAFDASSPENMTEAAELSCWWDEITVVPSALFCGGYSPRPIHSCKSARGLCYPQGNRTPRRKPHFCNRVRLEKPELKSSSGAN